jgi:thiosulfate/3-mercaptopyruvate sulfurtransferase
MTANFRDDPTTLVSTTWLAAWLDDPALRVLDASWYLPAMGRDARAEYAAGHIPGAQSFDIDAQSDQASSLPHMALPADEFARRMQAMGIGDADLVVVYDGMGLFSAARVWWLFRRLGHAKVAVLDGGLPKWRAEDRPLETAVPSPAPAHLQPRPPLARVATKADVQRASRDAAALILDARAAPRFRGAVPEPRAGLRAGHIPGSANLPFGELINPDGTLKDDAGLRAAFTAVGMDLSRPVITSCGSGVTGTILNLALERLGHNDHALYDGAWAEWGAADDVEVEKG